MSGILGALGRPASTGGALAVTVAPSSVTGFSNFGVPTTVYTDLPLVATATGGTPPYTYAWARVTGPTTIYPTGSGVADPYFFSYFNGYSTRTGTWACTVTDSVAATVTSSAATVTLAAQDGYI